MLREEHDTNDVELYMHSAASPVLTIKGAEGKQMGVFSSKTGFDPQNDLPDLTGRVVLVTGGKYDDPCNPIDTDTL